MQKYLEKVSKKFTGILPYQKPVLPNRQVKEKLKNPCWTINPSGVSFCPSYHALNRFQVNNSKAYRYPVCDRQCDRQYGRTICQTATEGALTETRSIPPVSVSNCPAGCIGSKAFTIVNTKKSENTSFKGTPFLV